MNIFIGTHGVDFIGLLSIKAHFLHIDKARSPLGTFDSEDASAREACGIQRPNPYCKRYTM